MDNREIDVTSEGLADLKRAVAIAWNTCPGRCATHWLKTPGDKSGMPGEQKRAPTLILLWGDKPERDAQPLPYPVDFEGALSFIQGWLKHVEYGPEPDHDGSNGKGWRVFNESWGHIFDYRYAIVGVQPAWAMYGK